MLASTADYENITGAEIASGDQARIEALLALCSSAVVASAYGQLIEQTVGDTITLIPWEGVCYFPQRPVTAVAVVLNGTTLVNGTDYRWTAGGPGPNGRAMHAQLIRLSGGLDSSWRYDDRPVVTYTHGWATVPAQLKAAVVAMTRSVVYGKGAPGRRSFTLGQYSESTNDADVQTPDLEVPESTKRILRRLCKAPSFGSFPVQTTQTGTYEGYLWRRESEFTT